MILKDFAILSFIKYNQIINPMKKYRLLFLFVVLMSLACVNLCAHNIEVANAEGVTIYYNWINDNTELAVSCKGSYYYHYDNEYSGNVVIPETVEYEGITYNVTSIAKNAFMQCSKLSAVTIPNSIISIGESAFENCTNLTTIIVPNSVTSIGKRAFFGCKRMGSVSITSSVAIDNSVFNGCKAITEFIIFVKDVVGFCNNILIGIINESGISNIKLIGNDGNEITNFVIPNNVTSIGDYAFAGCTGLTSIAIPNSLTSIGNYAFAGCTGLTSITIPNSLTSIGSSAFSGCCELTSVIVGSGVTFIGVNAFKETNLKKNIWLTNTPPTGYNNAKGTINYVSNDQFDISNKVVYKFLSSYFDVDGIRYVPVSPSDRTCDAIDCLYNESAENVNIGQTITNKSITLIVQKINPYTCYGNNYIKEVNLSLNGDIGENAFGGCNTLSTATINNQGHIGKSSFSGCIALSTVAISNQGNIGLSAFSGCKALKSATISNQGDIGSDAFSGCESLSSAKILNMGNIGTQAFYNCIALETVEIGQSVTSIDEKAFYDCSKLKGVILPDAVATIGSYAFSGCQAMTSVKMGNGVTIINKSTFSGCSSLDELIIGSKVETIDQDAFSGCSTLPSITIPQAVTIINNYAFSGCISLKEFIIADSDAELTIGSNENNPIFSSCPLETVYIGRNINYKTSSNYGYSPFYRNTSLKTVRITDKETEISENEFYGCTNLQSVTIGDGVTTIGNWAFSGCQSLKYFAFGSQVQTIGQEAFSDCTAVVEICSKAEIPPICGSQALDDINKWECKLYVPEGGMSAYQVADQWKDFFFTEEGEGTAGQNPDDPSIDNPDGKKCESPTISIVGDKIKFCCKTEGVLYHYSITSLDIKDGVINDDEVDMKKTYRVSVYASKDGYYDSDTTTKEIKMTSGGDVNEDGVVDAADVVKMVNIIMGK